MKPKFFATANLLLCLIFTVVSFSYIYTIAILAYYFGTYPLLYFAFFYSRKLLVPFLLSAFFLLKVAYLPRLKKLLNFGAWAAVIALFFVVVPVSLAFELAGQRLVVLNGVVSWSFLAIIEYALYISLAFVLFNRKTNCPFKSFILAFSSAQAIGFLYELPIFNPITHPSINHVFNAINPLFVNPYIISLIVFAAFLYYDKWQPTKLFWFALSVFLGFSVFYALDPWGFSTTFWFNGWLPRLPATFLMLTIALKYKQTKKF